MTSILNQGDDFDDDFDDDGISPELLESLKQPFSLLAGM